MSYKPYIQPGSVDDASIYLSRLIAPEDRNDDERFAQRMIDLRQSGQHDRAMDHFGQFLEKAHPDNSEESIRRRMELARFALDQHSDED